MNTDIQLAVIIDNFGLLSQAVETFDSRFTLRALRSISTIRKSKDAATAILVALRTAFPNPNYPARRVLESLLPQNKEVSQNGTSKASKDSDEEQIPEIWSYLGVLVQVRRGYIGCITAQAC